MLRKVNAVLSLMLQDLQRNCDLVHVVSLDGIGKATDDFLKHCISHSISLMHAASREYS